MGFVGSTLDDHVFSENPFKCEAKTEGSAAAGLVFSIAFPLVTPVAQVFKDMTGHQIHGLRGCGGSLQTRGQEDVADFNDPMRRFYSHEACIPRGRIGVRASNAFLKGRTCRSG